MPPQYVEVLDRPDERVSIELDVPVQIGGGGPLRRPSPVPAKAIALP